MAAYNYYGNPYYTYPAGYQVAQPQIQQQNVQPVQANQPNIIWITSEAEALSYPVAPNNAVTLWSTTEPVVYLKSADATGKPLLKTYDLVERKPPVIKATEQNYATQDDLLAVAGVVKGFDEIIGTLKNDIETMKGELYARKKPAPRKREEGDEE